MSPAADSTGSVWTVFRNRNLRLLELAWAGSVIGHYGYQVALGVYAYEAGGAAAVGGMFVLRTLGALATPPAAALGDRYPRVRVMFASDLVRAVLVLLTLLSWRRMHRSRSCTCSPGSWRWSAQPSARHRWLCCLSSPGLPKS